VRQPDARTRAVSLYLRGQQQIEVARKLKVSEATVSSWISEAKRDWILHASRERVERMSECLAELRLVKAEAWAQGDLRAVMKALHMEFRVLGAYAPDKLVVTATQIPWDQLVVPDGAEVEDDAEKILAAGGRGPGPAAGGGEGAGGTVPSANGVLDLRPAEPPE
jgi:predicted transcriptional regulator